MNDPTITAEPMRSKELYGDVHVRISMPDGHDLEGDVPFHDIKYGDLDGDGADEAVVYVIGGPSASVFAFMLYHEDTPAPRRMLLQTGFRVGARIEDGHLILNEPNFVGFEYNCCPSAETTKVEQWDGSQLVVLSEEVEPKN